MLLKSGIFSLVTVSESLHWFQLFSSSSNAQSLCQVVACEGGLEFSFSQLVNLAMQRGNNADRGAMPSFKLKVLPGMNTGRRKAHKSTSSPSCLSRDDTRASHQIGKERPVERPWRHSPLTSISITEMYVFKKKKKNEMK